jgi:hypothetical protein
MSITDERRFVAFTAPFTTQMNEMVSGKYKGVFYVIYTVLAVAVFAVTMIRPLTPSILWALVLLIAVIVVAPLFWIAWVWWRSRRQVVLTVTGDGLTVSTRPGVVFGVTGAQLGPWSTMGVALHLQSGSRRFILGGRDHRIGSSTRLDAPPVRSVDAYLWSPDFHALLGDAPSPTGDTARCLLYPNPYLAEQIGSFAFGEHLRFEQSRVHPSLFLDLRDDAVEVVDAGSGSAVRHTTATATATRFRPDSVNSGDGTTYNYPEMTGLTLRFPDAPPLTIGCVDLAGTEFRFSWQGDTDRSNERAVYVVSGGDWLALVERFGLTAQSVDRASRP